MNRGKLMTVREVAHLCDVPPGTIHAAIRVGELRALRPRPGAGFRLRRDDVAGWIALCAAKTRPGKRDVDPGQLAFDLQASS